jgi:uncharacterized membrane protein YeaQ/YmgE (transglycosylase-associated protein family)
MFGLIWWIIVGLIAGWLTGKIMSGGGYGPLMDIIVGILGALVGGFIMSHLGFAGSGGLIYTIIVAVIGAVILTLLLRLITRGRVRQVLFLRHATGIAFVKQNHEPAPCEQARRL